MKFITIELKIPYILRKNKDTQSSQIRVFWFTKVQNKSMVANVPQTNIMKGNRINLLNTCIIYAGNYNRLSSLQVSPVSVIFIMNNTHKGIKKKIILSQNPMGMQSLLNQQEYVSNSYALKKIGLQYINLYMHAAAIGNRKAINIYGISIFYNLIFVTIDTQTEYIIKVVHIIDDKSKVTFSIPSKTQKEDTSNSPADLFYTYISCKVIGLSNNTVMFWPRQDMQRQNDLLNHKFTSRTGKEAIDFQFTTYISSTANRQIIDMTFREMIIMAIFY